MMERTSQAKMIPVQLATDDGAYICNVREADLARIDAGTRGTFVVIHCAIRLDAMKEGLYELYETKVIETSSIDFYKSLLRNTQYVVRKGQPTLVRGKGEKE